MKIAAIQNNEDVTLTDEREVCTEFAQFYGDFLGRANPDCNGGTYEFFHSLQLASITSEMQVSLVTDTTA